MNATIVSAILVTMAASFAATRLLMSVVPRLGIVDHPDGDRRAHAKAVPLMGGLAVFVTVGSLLLVILSNSDALTGGEIGVRPYLGFLLGGFDGGFFGEAGVSYAGPNATARAALARDILRERLGDRPGFEVLRIDLIGINCREARYRVLTR